MKKTLALLALALLAGCEDWKIDMVGDHQSDDEYEHGSGSCSDCSSAFDEPSPPPAQLPPASTGSTGDAGASTNEDGGVERTSSCVGDASLCEFQITMAACEAWTGCTWIPR